MWQLRCPRVPGQACPASGPAAPPYGGKGSPAVHRLRDRQAPARRELHRETRGGRATGRVELLATTTRPRPEPPWPPAGNPVSWKEISNLRFRTIRSGEIADDLDANQ